MPQAIDRADWVYVTIPEKDMYDMPHPSIWNNVTEYAPGTHLVDPDTAKSINERLAAFQRAQIRQLQPKRDVAAERAVDRTPQEKTQATR